MIFHLFRHGQTEGNANKLITGWTNSQLTDLGKSQAKDLGANLDYDYDYAFSSDLDRAKDTMRLAFEEKDSSFYWGMPYGGKIMLNAPPFIIPSLRERFFDKWEWIDMCSNKLHHMRDITFHPPEKGESWLDMYNRILEALYNISLITQGMNTNKILISGHLGTLRVLDTIFTQNMDEDYFFDFEPENCQLFKYEIKDYQKFDVTKNLFGKYL